MKKTAVLLLCICLCFALCVNAMADEASDNAEDNTILVSTPEELRAIAEAPDGSYILGSNINMDGEEWVPFAFSGTLDGNGFSILNLSVTECGSEKETTIDGNHKEYETSLAGLFSALKGGCVKNVHLVNERVTITTADNVSVGGICGFAEDALIQDCSLQGTVELHSGNVMVCVGGIAGYATGRIDGVNADMVLISVDENKTGTKCEQFLAGAVAVGYLEIDNCDIHIEGYTSCHGYVHDGGLVGMHHYPDATVTGAVLYYDDDHVSGFITFFEDNADPRAYCEAFCGENLHWTMSGVNFKSEFKRDQRYDYKTDLYPHGDCTGTEFTEKVVTADCKSSDWGYTEYTCNSCGYSYKDHYTEPTHIEGEWVIVKEATLESAGLKEVHCTACNALLKSVEIPAHIPGEWETVTAPTYDNPGKEQQLCTDCGVLLAERETDPLKKVSVILLDRQELTLSYKDEMMLAMGAGPADAADLSVSWSSSAPEVVSVDEDGVLHALKTGSAVISCRSNDGGAEASCTVTVNYSASQLFIRYVLFGWLWY